MNHSLESERDLADSAPAARQHSVEAAFIDGFSRRNVNTFVPTEFCWLERCLSEWVRVNSNGIERSFNSDPEFPV